MQTSTHLYLCTDVQTHRHTHTHTHTELDVYTHCRLTTIALESIATSETVFFVIADVTPALYVLFAGQSLYDVQRPRIPDPVKSQIKTV